MNPDQLVEQYILDRFRNDHLEHHACPELHATDCTAEDGLYGMGTDGCSYVRFTATVACGGACEAPGPQDYECGEFGELPDIIKKLADRANVDRSEPISMTIHVSNDTLGPTLFAAINQAIRRPR